MAFSSPSAEKAAKKAGLSEDQIEGTGSNGRITVSDVEKAAADAAGPSADSAAAGSGGESIPAPDGEGTVADSDPVAPQAGGTAAAAAPQLAGNQPPVAPPPPVDSGKIPSSGSREIERTNEQGDWWCPYCDYSQTADFTSCQRCGAERDGDKVKAP